MNDKQDIVEQLRLWSEQLKSLSRWTSGKLKFPQRITLIGEAADEIEQLRKERDEARRYSCDLEARITMLEEDRRDTSNNFGTNPCSEIILPDYPLARDSKEIAKRKGWDCFKNAPVVKTLNGVVVSKAKAVPPKFELGDDDK